MPFREKAKSLFKTRSRTERDSLSKASSTDSQSQQRWPSNVYRPGEPMPRPKYRAVPKKEHKEKLESFSFAEAWRRKSFQSQYSPMGTRAPSRRNSSRGASRRNSIFSLGMKSASRTNSVTSVDTEKSGARHREGGSHGAAKATTLRTEPELEGDDDVGNVGKTSNMPSRQRTAEPGGAAAGRASSGVPPLNTAHDHQPFTEQELTLALKRSHLAVPTR